MPPVTAILLYIQRSASKFYPLKYNVYLKNKDLNIKYIIFKECFNHDRQKKY